jgi:PhzF family phenazine biosynthesis protein
MDALRFLQLDVFCDQPGGGNPLGVVFGASDWSAQAMQRFATWTNLVETTFVLPPSQSGASYRLRIFTPHREIAFAGHPSVGSAYAVLHEGVAEARDGLLHQQCDAGLLPLKVSGQGHDLVLAVQAPAARVLRTGLDADPGLASLLDGIRMGPLPPAFVEGGRRWWLAEFADERAVRGWHPDHAAIAALAHASDSLGLCVFARSDDPEFELVVRAFPAGVGIVEDPASGAANGLIGAYLMQCEPDGGLASGYRVSQGREIGRDARMNVDFDSDGSVWVGGRAHVVIHGSLDWPSAIGG